MEEGGEPAVDQPQPEYEAGKDNAEHGKRRRPEQAPNEAGGGACRWRRGGRFRRRLAHAPEEEEVRNGIGHAKDAEHPKRVAPPAGVGHPAAEHAPGDSAGDLGGGENGDRPRAQRGGVGVGRQRDRRRHEERFGDPHGAAEGEDVGACAGPAGGEGDEAPDDEAANGEEALRDPITENARERTAEGVDPQKHRADIAQLAVRHRQIVFERREHREHRLAVAVVEEVSPPHEGQEERGGPGGTARARGVVVARGPRERRGNVAGGARGHAWRTSSGDTSCAITATQSPWLVRQGARIVIRKPSE